MEARSLIGMVPVRGWVLIDIYDDGEEIRTYKNGAKLIITADYDLNVVSKQTSGDYRHRGDRARWARVVGLSQEAIDAGLQLGDDVLCERLEWSRGVPFARLESGYKKVWRIPVDKIATIREDSDREEWIAEFTQKLAAGKLLYRGA